MKHYQEVMVALSESVMKNRVKHPLATAGADRGQSPFAYSPILSALGYMTLEQTPCKLSILQSMTSPSSELPCNGVS